MKVNSLLCSSSQHIKCLLWARSSGARINKRHKVLLSWSLLSCKDRIWTSILWVMSAMRKRVKGQSDVSRTWCYFVEGIQGDLWWGDFWTETWMKRENKMVRCGDWLPLPRILAEDRPKILRELCLASLRSNENTREAWAEWVRGRLVEAEVRDVAIGQGFSGHAEVWISFWAGTPLLSRGVFKNFRW